MAFLHIITQQHYFLMEELTDAKNRKLWTELVLNFKLLYNESE